MKIRSFMTATALLASSASAFAPTLSSRHHHVAATTTASTMEPLNMFSGAGEGAPLEDDPEMEAKIETAAQSMGMSAAEYKLAMNARTRFETALSEARVTGGDTSKVSVTRDGHNPPRFLEVSITDAGKALGKETVSKELCAALKTCAEGSRKKRQEAQKEMMQWIAQASPKK